jgi:hypothetical protein
MREHPVPLTEQQAIVRRKGVRRTVLLFVVIVLIIYTAFIVSGVHR